MCKLCIGYSQRNMIKGLSGRVNDNQLVYTAKKGWLFQPEYGYLSYKYLSSILPICSHCSQLHIIISAILYGMCKVSPK